MIHRVRQDMNLRRLSLTRDDQPCPPAFLQVFGNGGDERVVRRSPLNTRNTDFRSDRTRQ
jgi:hypothetical protein